MKSAYLLCSTVYVKNENNEFLLIKHRKLNRWVPPGGKVVDGELPHQTAIRECFEETGLNVKLIGEVLNIEGGIIQPRGLEYNKLDSPFLSHLDFIYFAIPILNTELFFNTEEAESARWFNINDISTLNTFPSIHYWCDIFHKLN